MGNNSVTDQWVNKMYSAYTVEYYLAEMQTNGEALILGSISWTEKNPTNPSKARITTTKFQT